MYTGRFAFMLLNVSSIILLSAAVTFAQRTPITTGHERTILFVREHGSAKSIIAAAHFNDAASKNGLPYRAIARGTADPHSERQRSAHADAAFDVFDYTC
jgi:hypothetical protein